MAPALLQHSGRSCPAVGRRFYSGIFERHPAGRYTPSPDGYNSRRGIPALAFCGFDVTDSKPMNSAYPKSIKSLGDHLRAKRIEKGLLQADVAYILEVSVETITNWENNLSFPKIKYSAKISQFLGYNPFTFKSKTLGDKIKIYRHRHGLSHKCMGSLLGVNASTIGSWENNEHIPQKEFQKKLNKILNLK